MSVTTLRPDTACPKCGAPPPERMPDVIAGGDWLARKPRLLTLEVEYTCVCGEIAIVAFKRRQEPDGSGADVIPMSAAHARRARKTTT